MTRSFKIVSLVVAAATLAVVGNLAGKDAKAADMPLTKNEKLLAAFGKLSPAEREKRLIEDAKKEGQVVLLTQVRGRRADAQMKLFSKRYPFLKLGYTSNSSPIVTEKLVAEEAAGRHLTDGMSFNTPNFRLLKEHNIAARNPTPTLNLIPAKYAGFKDPEDRFLPYYTTAHGIGFNSKFLKGADEPKSYQDLCNPKYKGQVSFEPAESQFLIGMYEMFGKDEKKVEAWLECIGKNKPIIQKGHTTRLMLLLAGDHTVSPDMLPYAGVQRARKNPKKAPFKVAFEAPLMLNAAAALINNNAVNIHAAALFVDWCMSDELQEYLYKDFRGAMKGKHPYFPDNAIIVPYSYVDQGLEDRLHAYWKKHVSTTRY